eukprot:528342-Amorphochlora_amoeboformis.AAC.1
MLEIARDPGDTWRSLEIPEVDGDRWRSLEIPEIAGDRLAGFYPVVTRLIVYSCKWHILSLKPVMDSGIPYCCA